MIQGSIEQASAAPVPEGSPRAPARVSSALPTVDLGPTRERAVGIARGLELGELELNTPELNVQISQLRRDRATRQWQGVIAEAIVGECQRRMGELSRLRCTDQVKRDLWHFNDSAVHCILSGNAAPDYVAEVELDNLPTHSIPLQRGAVILCDGALARL